MIVVPLKNDLTLEELGVYSAMINVPEIDYCSATELCNYMGIKKDEYNYVDFILNSLLNKGYLLKIYGKYAVNKLKIPAMEVI